mmetsp:Transcript_8287/g.23665  ORF Transcript_8287/g.23665 Transcript_8287/m.23665 type:complete len:315 (+) Transcript_8287:115-1059(+)
MPRGLLRVRGRDTVKFLQGLTTQHVASALEGGGAASYGAFLSAKGRLLGDALFYFPRGEGDDEVLLDVDASFLPGLQRHLKMYKLRSKVKIKDVSSELRVLQAPLGLGLRSAAEDATILNTPTSELKSYAILTTPDPRHEAFGHRAVVPADAAAAAGWDAANDDVYAAILASQGVLEGEALAGLVPLEANVDVLQGVSFHKGCYVGQELTARAQFKGAVRKRLLPVLLRPDSGAPAPARLLPLPGGKGAPVAGWEALSDEDLNGPAAVAAAEAELTLSGDGKPKSVGKVIMPPVPGSNVAVAMLRLEYLMEAKG